MSNILLIEPDYRSKFPPLGLLRIATFHKERGDTVTFARGKVPALRDSQWHRVYVASLFTWELPRTVDTIKYYLPTVSNPSDLIVGGIGATLNPDYIRRETSCQVITGPLDTPGKLGPEAPSIADYVPDYGLLDSVSWEYRPTDSYFCRVTTGCIRKCKFCAVPLLEPVFGYSKGITQQIADVDSRFGQRQHLVVLDNNILGVKEFPEIIAEIRDQGFQAGAKRNNRQRTVDFNQGIDARLVNAEVAKLLGSISLSPVRLAFDHDSVEPHYRLAITRLAEYGLKEFTNYLLYNFNDTPESLYRRLRINTELSQELGIRVTGFPMRFIPMDDVHRQHVSNGWCWRYLRGIQCILHATRGLVSPNPSFFERAFGKTYEDFIRLICMPDRYILDRDYYEYTNPGPRAEWRGLFDRLSVDQRNEFLSVLAELNGSRDRDAIMQMHREFQPLLEHYYPNGRVPPNVTKRPRSSSSAGRTRNETVGEDQ